MELPMLVLSLCPTCNIGRYKLLLFVCDAHSNGNFFYLGIDVLYPVIHSGEAASFCPNCWLHFSFTAARGAAVAVTASLVFIRDTKGYLVVQIHQKEDIVYDNKQMLCSWFFNGKTTTLKAWFNKHALGETGNHLFFYIGIWPHSSVKSFCLCVLLSLL